MRPLTLSGSPAGILDMWCRHLLLGVLSAMTLAAAPVELVPADLRGAVQPQVAVEAAGRIHVTFGQGNAVYYTDSADGKKFSAPVKVGELDKLALGMRRGPRIAVSGGLVLITAISHSDGKVHAWTSANQGKSWKEGAALNTVDGSAREGLQGLASNGDGRVVAVWLDLRAGRGQEVWSRQSRDGGKSWEDEMRVYAAPGGGVCPCCVPNVAISPQGEVAVMWRNDLEGARDLYVAVRKGDKPFAEAKKLGTGTWNFKGCPMDGGSLVFSPEGKWLAVWRREKGVFASFLGTEEMPLSEDASQPVASSVGEVPVILWESGDALMMKRGKGEPERFAEGGKAASVARGKDGACVVWEGKTGEGKTLLFERVK